MKVIKGKLEFFLELGLTAAVVRETSSRGGFDGARAIKEGHGLVVWRDQNIVFKTTSLEVDYEQMNKHHSGVIIPRGLKYEDWLNYLRENLEAELTVKY